jgi:serine/threonine protein kinase
LRISRGDSAVSGNSHEEGQRRRHLAAGLLSSEAAPDELSAESKWRSAPSEDTASTAEVKARTGDADDASSDDARSDDIASTLHYQWSIKEGGAYLDRYRLESILGRGGMGMVWLAYDAHLDRRVAIKVVRPDLKVDAEAADEFLREGRKLAALSHPNILPVYDCGNDGGVWYLVSEYVPRGTLANYLKHESLTFKQAAELVAGIADAAHYAHMRGLVHRDIKAANILMRQDGRPLLADFGLAIAEEEQLREAPGTMGTYAYMAPEQLLGESRFVDGRADIYSLGVVLYRLLTGRLPYVASNCEEYRALVQNRDARPPRSVRDDIPAELEAICLKCLARRPADRYSTAADLAAALRKSVAGRGTHTQLWLVGAAAAAVMLIAMIAGAVWLPNGLGSATPLIVDHSSAIENAPPDIGNAPLPGTTVVVPARSGLTAARAPIETVEVVEHPLPGPAARWGIQDDGQTLWFLSDNLCLLELGDYQGGDLKLSVAIEQSDWTGKLGVYWGFKPHEDRPRWNLLECFQLYPRSSDALRLRNSIMAFPESTLEVVQDFERSQFDLGPTPLARSHRIGFEIRDGHLVGLEWDDLDLSDLLHKRAMQMPESHSVGGRFGLFSNSASGRFRELKLNGSQARFRAASNASGE